MNPTSVEGIAAMAHVQWVTDAPPFREGSEEYADELSSPANKTLAAIWRAASGETGVPTA